MLGTYFRYLDAWEKSAVLPGLRRTVENWALVLPVEIQNMARRRRMFQQMNAGAPDLKAEFKRVHGYDLNLDNPQTFNEKIQWRKIYDRDPLWSLLCDKYHCKKFIRGRLGRELQPATLDWVKNPTELPDDIHLQNVVLKCTHTSGRILFCGPESGLSRDAVNRHFVPWVRAEFGTRLLEWCYSQAEKAIIVEPKMLRGDGSPPPDAKFHVFDGKVKCIQVVENDLQNTHLSDGPVAFVNPDWTPSEVHRAKDTKLDLPEPPPYLADMIEVAEKLAAGIDYVRVDFMVYPDHFLVGEMTVYPASGMKKMGSYEIDLLLGSHWTLPVLNASRPAGLSPRERRHQRARNSTRQPTARHRGSAGTAA